MSEKEKTEIMLVDADLSVNGGRLPQGWSLKEVVHVERIEAMPGQHSGHPPQKLSKAILVLERTLTDRTIELEDQLAKKMDMWIEERNKNDSLASASEKANAELEVTRKKLADTELRLSKVYDEYENERARRRKMEEDIAKIRTAIGSEKMRQILEDS